MKKLNWPIVKKWLDSRHVRERGVLLAGALGVLFMGWLSLVHDTMVLWRANEAASIVATNGRILDEQNRQAEIRATYTSDPNTFALTRQRELQEAARTADARLNLLYGELISPQQMSQVLTTILQRDTTLRLVSLENQPSEALLTQAADPAAGGADAGIQVFKHGLRMVFQGNFLEAIRYMRSLEELEGNFFWESLEYSLEQYPDGQISLDIYTLSTQQGWIGV